MTAKRPNGSGRRVKAAKAPGAQPQETQGVTIDVERCGDWMPAEELRDRAMTALAASAGMTLNLDRIDHLDASAMQVLLAIEAAEENLGQHLQLTHASAKLRQWFELSGATGHFFENQRNADE
jgi:anti-anti-sigma regulatory factor